MEINVHTAVIGGGPAGMACAIALQRKRITNCVIDRAVFPRDKACAGIVTEKTYELLKRLMSNHSDVLQRGNIYTCPGHSDDSPSDPLWVYTARIYMGIPLRRAGRRGNLRSCRQGRRKR